MAYRQVIVFFSLLWITINATAYEDSYSDYYQEPVAYQFEWTVKNDPSGNDYRQEERRDGQLTTGLYQVLLADGRYQTVKYRIDKDSGFLADVTYIGEAQPYPAYPLYPTNPLYPNVLPPTYPSEPAKPSHPTYPAPSLTPAYPSEAAKPAYPTYPTPSLVPAYPSEPAKPSHPTYPTPSLVPAYPSEPAKPAYPTYPAVSLTPAYPSEPAKPSHPTYPTPSLVPAYPSEPAKPSHPGYPGYPGYPSYPSYPAHPEGNRPKINFMEYPPLEVPSTPAPPKPQPSEPAYMAPIMAAMTPKPQTVTEAPTAVTEPSVVADANYGDYTFPLYRIDMRASKASKSQNKPNGRSVEVIDDAEIDYIRPAAMYSAPEKLGSYVVDHRKGASRKPSNSDYLVPESIRNQN